MNIISTSFGNDSCAMIQWCIENDLEAEIVYIDTGWASDDWHIRVKEMIKKFDKYYQTKIIKPEVGFEDLCKMKKGFPFQKSQWCTGLLKGIPYLNYLDEIDPDLKAITFIGKRREESEARKNTPCIEISEYHGNRLIAHPLYLHTEDMRNDLLFRAGITPLPHRSHECHPCVNANRGDLQSLTVVEIQRVEDLEKAVGKNMFRAKKHNGAEGIRQIVDWANYGAGKYDPDQDDLFVGGCGSPFGCGL